MKKKHMIFGVLAALAVSVCGFTALAAEQIPEVPEHVIQAQAQEGQEAFAEETARESGKQETTSGRRAENEVKRMEILQQPNTTTYYGDNIRQNGAIDLEGIKLRLVYDNGATKDVCPRYPHTWSSIWEVCDGSGEIVEVGTRYREIYPEGRYEDREIELVFACGKAEIELPLQLIDAVGLSLKKAPDHTEYCGENVYGYPQLTNKKLLEGMELEVTFEDGAIKSWDSCPALSWACELDKSSSSMLLTVGGLECEIPVTYQSVESLSIIKEPEKKVYESREGEDLSLDVKGMELKVEFADGTSGVISGDEVESEHDYIPCKKEDGGIVYTDFRKELSGRRWGASWNSRVGYGPAQAALKVDDKTALYQIHVARAVETLGTAELGQTCHFFAEAGKTYEYTFTPAETGVYQYDGNFFDMPKVYAEQVELPSIDRAGNAWLLKEGKEYRFEIQIQIYSRDISFAIQKKSSILVEEEISLGETKEILAGTDSLPYIYKFVPGESGVYYLHSEGSADRYDSLAWLCDAEIENCWDKSFGETEFFQDENNSWEERNRRFYLTEGQEYVCVIFGENDAFHVELRQENDTCAHEWHLEGDYWCCLGRGWQREYCRKCQVSAYTAIAPEGHVFEPASVVREATAAEEGVQENMCRWCGKVTHTAIPKLPPVPTPEPVLKLNAYKIPMQVKQSTTALKVIEMAEGDAVASWKSSNPKIVKVTKKGKLKAGKKKGKAVITVTLKSGKTAKVTVKVQKKKVRTKKIKVTPKKITLKKGHTYRLAPVVTPITTQEKVKYSTSKKKVASVSKKGVIKAKKPGTAKIKIKSGRKKVTVTVKVTK